MANGRLKRTGDSGYNPQFGINVPTQGNYYKAHHLDDLIVLVYIDAR
jgi:hypothetical protein